MADPVDRQTNEIFMSVYNTDSVQDAFSKMGDLQYRMVKDDNDEEKNLIPKGSSGSSTSLLESWLLKCSLRSRAHSSASIACNLMYNIISIPKLVCGGAAVALSFWATSDTNGSSHEVRVAVAVLSATSTFLDGMIRLFRFSEKEFRHSMAAGLYSQLCRKIEVNVFSPSPETSVQNMNTLLAEVSVQFSNIITFSPNLKF
jgi:hypothetical protein